MLAVGLMSGTSLDGVDAALVEITGCGESTQVYLKAFETYPFTAQLKVLISKSLNNETATLAEICSLNFALGREFAEAVLALCQSVGIDSATLGFVASHGQTIYHLPQPTQGEVASTLQIGNPAVISELTHTTVISDFRSRDMTVGGLGAPIVPYSEYVLYRSDCKTRLLQNIGCIGNVTVIPRQAKLTDLLAFDTGPGNMVIDELCRRYFKEEYDRDGQYAALGKVDQRVLSTLLKDAYFKLMPPKTTGRERFGRQYVDALQQQFQLSANDWIATATELTAQTIAQALRPFCQGETELIVSGGGSYNPTLMARIQKLLPEAKVQRQEDLGLRSDAKEAIAMVVLGNQTLHHRPSNVPSATGANRPVILGNVTYYD